MDKKKSILNVFVSIAFKIVITILTLIVRRFLIHCIGSDANGLNSLFLSIIGFLSVAELGIGTAISFSMYKPIVNGETRKVSALYNLFKNIYLVIGGVILVGGLIVTPFLPYLAADYSSLNINIFLTFLLMLASVVITYAFSAKISLINAYKNNYISTLINSGGVVFQNLLQIIVLIFFRSFVLYLACRIVAAILQWLATNIVAKKKYSNLISTKEKIDHETSLSVKKNIKAMFMHKIGGVLVNSADSLIISAFIGVVALGGYSNYTTVMTSMVGVLYLFFTPLTSIIGHFVLKSSKEKVNKYFNFFYTFNFILGCIFFTGYYAVIDDFVAIVFGAELVLSKSISLVITINYFIQFMRQTVLLFRDATGTFYNDRFKPLLEGLVNVLLSIALVIVLPDDFKIVGVIIATIITNLLICHVVEPYVLFKYGFSDSATKFQIKNYLFILFYLVFLSLFNFIKLDVSNHIISFFLNGIIAFGFSIIPCYISILLCKDFIPMFKQFFVKK